MTVAVSDRLVGVSSSDPVIESPYLTRRQAAQYLNMSEQWLAQGGRYKVPHFKIGSVCRYSRAQLDDWMRQQQVMSV